MEAVISSGCCAMDLEELDRACVEREGIDLAGDSISVVAT
jgi:hypothetical protein